jgi:hypothetical protein
MPDGVTDPREAAGGPDATLPAPKAPGATPAVPADTLGTGQPPPAPDSETLAIPAEQQRRFAESAGRRPAPPLPAGYEFVRELGRGGWGVVYLVRQVALKREVALKVLLSGGHSSEQQRRRFLAEAEAASAVAHPGVVQVYDFGTLDGQPWITLEFCPGGTLADRLRGQRLPAREAALLVERLARAVAAAHQKGVTHRDLKPANVLYSADGSPKVGDFGLAKVESSDLTDTGAVLGTPTYMAPEQAAGRTKEVGHPADVYALGAMLYELLTGRPPLRGETAMDTIQLVLTREPARPARQAPGVPHDLDAVVMKCLEKDPRNRYATAAELATDLASWSAGLPVRARRQTPLYRAERYVRRHRYIALAALAVALAAPSAYVLFADAGYQVPGGDRARRLIDRLGWSVYRPVPAGSATRDRALAMRAELGRALLASCPERPAWWNSGNSIAESRRPPYVYDAWAQAHTTTALLSCPETDAATRALLADALLELFDPPDRRGRPFEAGYGWLLFHDMSGGKLYPASVSTAWALPALSLLLARADELGAERRAKLQARLEDVQKTLDKYQSAEPGSGRRLGAWNLYPDQVDPSQSNTFVTATVFLGLLELRRAGLGWHGDPAHLDRLLRAAHEHLVGEFDGRGWRAPPANGSPEVIDGLTLWIFALLLRAEAEAGLELPGAIAARASEHAAECATRPADHPNSVAVYVTPFRHGGRLYNEEWRVIRFVWYPAAVEVAARLVSRCQRTGAPRDEAAAARRVLGRLLIETGPKVMETTLPGPVFVATDLLLALSRVE